MKSKFSLAQAFLIPAFSFLLPLGVGSLLIFGGVGKTDKSGFLLTCFGLVFLIMSLFIARHYLKMLRVIEINLDGITIKGLSETRTVRWSDVKKIKLTGKEPEGFWFMSMPMEAVSIRTKDELKEVFLVKFYSNMAAIRTALHFIKVRIDKGEEITSDCFLNVQRIEPAVADLSSLKKFGKNHLLTLNGVTVYGSMIFPVGLFYYSNNPLPVLTWIFLCGAMLFFGPAVHGYQLHYFKLNEEYLVVKNHVWFWVNDAYYIKDIRLIVFEEPHKMSTAMRVVTNNYESRMYPAGSINKKEWFSLREQLKDYKVKFKNEAYFE